MVDKPVSLDRLQDHLMRDIQDRDVVNMALSIDPLDDLPKQVKPKMDPTLEADFTLREAVDNEPDPVRRSAMAEAYNLTSTGVEERANFYNQQALLPNIPETERVNHAQRADALMRILPLVKRVDGKRPSVPFIQRADYTPEQREVADTTPVADQVEYQQLPEVTEASKPEYKQDVLRTFKQNRMLNEVGVPELPTNHEQYSQDDLLGIYKDYVRSQPGAWRQRVTSKAIDILGSNSLDEAALAIESGQGEAIDYWQLALFDDAYEREAKGLGLPQFEGPDRFFRLVDYAKKHGRGVGDMIAERLPFYGGVEQAKDLSLLAISMRRINRGQGTLIDEWRTAQFIAKAQDEADDEWWEKSLDIISYMPGFMVEVLTTAGAYTAGRMAVVKGMQLLGGRTLKEVGEQIVAKMIHRTATEMGEEAAQRMIAKHGLQHIKRELGKELVENGVERFARTRALGELGSRAVGMSTWTLTNPQMIWRSTAQQLVDGYFNVPEGTSPLEFDDGGRLIRLLGKEDDSLVSALVKGYGDAWIELASERTGLLMHRYGARFAKRFPGVSAVWQNINPLAKLAGVKAAIMNRFMKQMLLKGHDDVAKRALRHFERAGFHGFVEEWFEERVGDAARMATGLQSVEWPDGEQLLAEAVAFMVPGVARSTWKDLTVLSAASKAARMERQAKERSVQDAVTALQQSGVIDSLEIEGDVDSLLTDAAALLSDPEQPLDVFDLYPEDIEDGWKPVTVVPEADVEQTVDAYHDEKMQADLIAAVLALSDPSHQFAVLNVPSEAGPQERPSFTVMYRPVEEPHPATPTEKSQVPPAVAGEQIEAMTDDQGRPIQQAMSARATGVGAQAEQIAEGAEVARQQQEEKVTPQQEQADEPVQEREAAQIPEREEAETGGEVEQEGREQEVPQEEVAPVADRLRKAATDVAGQQFAETQEGARYEPFTPEQEQARKEQASAEGTKYLPGGRIIPPESPAEGEEFYVMPREVREDPLQYVGVPAYAASLFSKVDRQTAQEANLPWPEQDPANATELVKGLGREGLQQWVDAGWGVSGGVLPASAVPGLKANTEFVVLMEPGQENEIRTHEWLHLYRRHGLINDDRVKRIARYGMKQFGFPKLADTDSFTDWEETAAATIQLLQRQEDAPKGSIGKLLSRFKSWVSKIVATSRGEVVDTDVFFNQLRSPKPHEEADRRSTRESRLSVDRATRDPVIKLFDRAGPDARLSVDYMGQRFYNPLAIAVNKINMPDKARIKNPQSFINQLKKFDNVTDELIRWSGLQDAIESGVEVLTVGDARRWMSDHANMVTIQYQAPSLQAQDSSSTDEMATELGWDSGVQMDADPEDVNYEYENIVDAAWEDELGQEINGMIDLVISHYNLLVNVDLPGQQYLLPEEGIRPSRENWPTHDRVNTDYEIDSEEAEADRWKQWFALNYVWEAAYDNARGFETTLDTNKSRMARLVATRPLAKNPMEWSEADFDELWEAGLQEANSEWELREDNWREDAVQYAQERAPHEYQDDAGNYQIIDYIEWGGEAVLFRNGTHVGSYLSVEEAQDAAHDDAIEHGFLVEESDDESPDADTDLVPVRVGSSSLTSDQQEVRKHHEQAVQRTKWSRYQIASLQNVPGQYGEAIYALDPNVSAMMPGSYTYGTHWPADRFQNFISHARYKRIDTADDSSVFFLMEAQSDASKHGRQRGVLTHEDIAEEDQAENEMQGYVDQIFDLIRQWPSDLVDSYNNNPARRVEGPTSVKRVPKTNEREYANNWVNDLAQTLFEPANPENAAGIREWFRGHGQRAKGVEELVGMYYEAWMRFDRVKRIKADDAVPDMPYVHGGFRWLEITLGGMLQQAALLGDSHFAIPGAPMASTMWDTRRWLRDVSWEIKEGNSKNGLVTLSGVNIESDQVTSQTIAITKLADYVGEAEAARINSEIENGFSKGYVDQDRIAQGSIWMEPIYDQAGPAILKRMAKRHGSTVAKKYWGPRLHVEETEPGVWMVKDEDGGQEAIGLRSQESAEAAMWAILEKRRYYEMGITDSMRQGITEEGVRLSVDKRRDFSRDDYERARQQWKNKLRSRPDLADVGEHEDASIALEAADAYRIEQGRGIGDAERKEVDEGVARVEALLRDDKVREQEENNLLGIAYSGTEIRGADVWVARHLVNEYGKQAYGQADQDLTLKAMRLAEAYREMGSQQSLAFRMRQARYKDEASLMRDHLMHTVLSPGMHEQRKLDQIKEKLNEAKAAGDNERVDELLEARRKLLERDARKIEMIKKKLAQAGLDLNDFTEEDLADPHKVLRLVRIVDTNKSGAFKWISEWWINAILGGPATHVANVAGNTGFMLWENTLQRWTEVMVNSVLPGDKTKAPMLGELRHLYTGFYRALIPAAKNFMVSYSTEQPAMFADEIAGNDNTKLEASEQKKGLPSFNFKVKVAGKERVMEIGGRQVRIPSRLLQAEDEWFKTLIGHAMAASVAYRLAKKHKLKGDKLEEFMEMSLKDRNSTAWIQAKEEAVRLTFQSKPGAFGRWLQSTRTRFPAVMFILPFIRTPVNIFKIGVKRTPLGTLRLMWKGARHAGSKAIGDGTYVYHRGEAVRDISSQLWAWLMTMMLISLTAPDDEDGLPVLTGSKPAKYRDRQGREHVTPATSVRLWGKWHNYNRLEPWAVMLATTADLINGYRDAATGKDANKALGKVYSSMLNQVQDKTFLRGLSDISKAISKPDSYGLYWAQNFAGSWVPNYIRSAGRGSDEFVRESRMWGDMSEAWWGRFWTNTKYKMFPGLVDPPPPKVDMWGRDIKKVPQYDIPLTTWLYHMAVPIQKRQVRDDLPAKFDRMMLEWNQRHPWANEVVPSPMTPTFQFTAGGKTHHFVIEDPQLYHDVLATTGKLRREMLPNIEGMMNFDDPTETNIKVFKRVMSESASAVKREMLIAPYRQLIKEGKIREQKDVHAVR